MPLAPALKLKREHRRFFLGALRTSGIVGVYGLWILGFRLLFLTLTTSFLMYTSSKAPSLDEISDVFASNELPVMALAAVTFILLLKGFYPLFPLGSGEVISLPRLQRRFLPGLGLGLALGAAIVGAFLLSSIYRFLGSFIQLEEAPLALLGILIRIASLLTLAYCEEYVFRRLVFPQMLERLENPPPAVAAALTSLLYILIKLLQFELGIVQLATLFLLSVLFCAWSLRLRDQDFEWGAGVWAGVLILFHPVLSLPVFGSDFSGLFLVKLQNGTGTSAPHLLTGGVGGPLSSLALQLLIILELGRTFLRYKNKI